MQKNISKITNLRYNTDKQAGEPTTHNIRFYYTPQAKHLYIINPRT